MKKFSDLGLDPIGLKGKKIGMDEVLGQPIVLEAYKVVPSKFEKDTDCLHFQFLLNGEQRISFSVSRVLIDQIRRISKDDFPIETTIKKVHKHFEFT